MTFWGRKIMGTLVAHGNIYKKQPQLLLKSWNAIQVNFGIENELSPSAYIQLHYLLIVLFRYTSSTYTSGEEIKLDFGTPIYLRPRGQHHRRPPPHQPTHFRRWHPGNRARKPGKSMTETLEWGQRSTKRVGRRNKRHAALMTRNSYPCSQTSPHTRYWDADGDD